MQTVKSYLQLSFSTPDPSGRTVMTLMTVDGPADPSADREYLAIQIPVQSLEEILINLREQRPAKTGELATEFYCQ